VLGVDGCKSGWVGVLLTPGGAEAVVADRIEDLVTATSNLAVSLGVVAIDMPVGLPDHEPRNTDVLARALLPVGRKSSVFPTPSRAATRAAGYLEANAVNRSVLGKGLSRQAFHLIPKIVEVDEYVRQGPAVTVIEAHPEVSFTEMDPACVVASKRSEAGRAARRAALRGAGIQPPAYRPGQGYAADDLLDACAVAWTAARYAAGTAYSLPDPPEVFSDGIPAAIWV
jgi:predicted RNase H-like nuclease